MSKRNDAELDDWPRDEYGPNDLQGGVRGKHAERFKAGTNLVPLEPDVAEAFPDGEAVNEALRLLMRIAKTSVKRERPSKRRQRVSGDKGVSARPEGR